MFVDFFVFDTQKAAFIINKLEQEGFNVYASNDCSDNWLKTHFNNEKRYRLYFDMFEIVSGKCGDYPYESPVLAISVLEDYNEWLNVDLWIKGCIFGEFENSITSEDLNFDKPATQHRVSPAIGVETVIDGIKSQVLSTPPDDIDLKDGYKYQSYYNEALDTKYYEVIAPSSETPFTVVVYNFKQKDDTFLFSDIYASNSWGRNRRECRYDFDFLKALWKHLGLPGEFTMDIVKRRVDACYPDRVKRVEDLESEPSVYRRPMADVMNMKRKNVEGREYIKPTRSQ